MLRLTFIFIFFAGFSFAQDTVVVDDNSIWWAKSSCAVDFRCYDNIDEFVEVHCSDSITIQSIELRENVFENSVEVFTKCRAKRLAEYLKSKHEIIVDDVVGTSIKMTSSEMRQAMAEQNYRTIIIVLGPVVEDHAAVE